MKKRSKAVREPIKGQRRKTAEPERRNGRKAVRSSTAGKETKVARLTRERDEALEHQTATSDDAAGVSVTSVPMWFSFQIA